MRSQIVPRGTILAPATARGASWSDQWPYNETRHAANNAEETDGIVGAAVGNAVDQIVPRGTILAKSLFHRKSREQNAVFRFGNSVRQFPFPSRKVCQSEGIFGSEPQKDSSSCEEPRSGPFEK